MSFGVFFCARFALYFLPKAAQNSIPEIYWNVLELHMISGQYSFLQEEFLHQQCNYSRFFSRSTSCKKRENVGTFCCLHRVAEVLLCLLSGLRRDTVTQHGLMVEPVSNCQMTLNNRVIPMLTSTVVNYTKEVAARLVGSFLLGEIRTFAIIWRQQRPLRGITSVPCAVYLFWASLTTETDQDKQRSTVTPYPFYVTQSTPIVFASVHFCSCLLNKLLLQELLICTPFLSQVMEICVTFSPLCSRLS